MAYAQLHPEGGHFSFIDILHDTTSLRINRQLSSIFYIQTEMTWLVSWVEPGFFLHSDENFVNETFPLMEQNKLPRRAKRGRRFVM